MPQKSAELHQKQPLSVLQDYHRRKLLHLA